MKKMQIYCYAGKNPRCQPSPISIGDVCAFPAAKQKYYLIISYYQSQKN